MVASSWESVLASFSQRGWLSVGEMIFFFFPARTVVILGFSGTEFYFIGILGNQEPCMGSL